MSRYRGCSSYTCGCRLHCATRPTTALPPVHIRDEQHKFWVLPEDYCKRDPCNFNTEMLVSIVGNPCPTLGQLLASRILYALLVGEKQHETARARFCKKSCSEVGQLLVNSSPTPLPTRSARVFLAIVLWQHQRFILWFSRAHTKSGWLEVDQELNMGCQLLTRTFLC